MDEEHRCRSCLLCLNKDFNPFCIEQGKVVNLDFRCRDWETCAIWRGSKDTGQELQAS
jgi:hypothetical protein